MPRPRIPPFRIVATARFSVFAPAYPIAKDGAVELNEDFYSASNHEPVRDLGVGDSALLFDLFDGSDSGLKLFEEVRDEVHWHDMMHKGGAVPRLVSMQGSFVYGPLECHDDSSSAASLAVAEPVYRHPADEQPPMVAWTSAVLRAKLKVEEALGGQQMFNHALVQYYRNGNDYISEHADKTLDVARGSAIVNVSLGATRTMVLRAKKGLSSSRRNRSGDGSHTVPANEYAKSCGHRSSSSNSTSKTRPTQRIALPGSSLFVLGWATNRAMTHEIRQDKRLSSEKRESEQACGGERISITFRTVATFQRLRDGCLFGQGAVCKTEAALDARLAREAKDAAGKAEGQAEGSVEAKASNSSRQAVTASDASVMVAMFGEENMSPTFDWARCYGMGFDALDMATTETATMMGSGSANGSDTNCRFEHEKERAAVAASVTVANNKRSTSEAAAEAAVRAAFQSLTTLGGPSFRNNECSSNDPSSSRSCSLMPHDFFCAWGGVLVLAFVNFPPPLLNLKAALNEACADAAAEAGNTARGENFGSKWPKATLAATADDAPPLSLPQLAKLRQVCLKHGSALRQSLLAQSTPSGFDRNDCSWSGSLRRGSACQREEDDVAVPVTTVTAAHYKHRGLEALPGRRPPRLVPFSILRCTEEEAAEGGREGGQVDEKEGSAIVNSAAATAAVRSVVEEWCGDRLSSYLTGANQKGSEASSYRDSSPVGSTLVAFLNGCGPRGAHVLDEEDSRSSAGAMPPGLAKALRAFRSAIDHAFPGRFVWMDEDSLHCTLRSLDW